MNNSMLKHLAKRFIVAIAVFTLLIICNQLTDGSFLSQRNLTIVLKQGSVLMILASSLMILLISKNFDLSGGSGVYLTGVIVALLILEQGMNIYLAILIAIIAGVLMGALNGIFVGFLGLPAFIVTLAAQQIFRGIGYTITNASTIGPMPKELTNISEAYVSPVISFVLVASCFIVFVILTLLKYKKFKAWYSVGNIIENIIYAAIVGAIAAWIFTGYKGIPMAVVVAGIVAFGIHLLTTKTVFGRQIYLIGGNIEAAKLAGIKTKRRIFDTYLIEGLMYGIGGVVLTARLGGAAATGGNLLELDAVAAACIGGTSMNGGSGSIIGVAGGVIILTFINNVMSLMNLSSYLQMVVKGIILLIAICIDLYTTKAKYNFKLVNKKKA